MSALLARLKQVAGELFTSGTVFGEPMGTGDATAEAVAEVEGRKGNDNDNGWAGGPAVWGAR